MLTTKDFLKGVDFTGINPATGANHNDLIELAIPLLDTNNDGKGLCVFTNDTALNAPVVPDAATYTKWKRYLWIRKVWQSQPVLYAWQDDGLSNLGFLKWKQMVVDTATLQAAIDAAVITANAASATANAANVASAQANTNANTAANNASAALITANNASSAATAASTSAAASQTTATGAQTTANTALAAANATKSVAAALTPGTAGQKVRTNVGATAAEWYDELNNYVKISDRKANGTGAGAAANGANNRAITTIDNDAGANITVATPAFTLKKGIWKVEIIVPCSSTSGNRANLIKTSDSSIVLNGTSVLSPGASSTFYSHIRGVITLAVDTQFWISHYFNGADANAYALGRASSVADASQEVYTVAEFWKLNA